MVKNNLNLHFNIAEALTPLDGRNRNKLTSLTQFFSELALDKYRIKVEIKYLQKLASLGVIRQFSQKEDLLLKKFISTLSEKDYAEIRLIENITNHEMKAVEEYIKKKLAKTSLKDVEVMVHFGLTSDDINNLAYALMLKSTLSEVLLPAMEQIALNLSNKARNYKDIAMLSRTHGQPAAPTTLGKELLIYVQRLKSEIENLKNCKISAKLTGNVGNLNAHKFIYPKINWLKFSQTFVASFGLVPDLATTQIEPYDSFIRIFQNILRINNILIGLSWDIWTYISLGYFKQKVVEKEVGSTALPHKVNPIYFEGAEGGLGIANALFEFYSRKLSHSRLQRDLSDSTVRRSAGIALGYSLLSYQSLNTGLNRIAPNSITILHDLQSHYEVLSEAVQNFFRSKGYNDAYDRTKAFFRGKIIAPEGFRKFIDSLGLTIKDKKLLSELTPETYTGFAEELVDKLIS